MKRTLYAGFGWACVAIGTVGIVLPVLPTTPFMIVAAWAFARSSPRFHSWLESHRVFGPYIKDWEHYRVIPRSAKVLAVTMMSASFIWVAMFSAIPLFAVIPIGIAKALVALYILTKPSHRPDVT